MIELKKYAAYIHSNYLDEISMAFADQLREHKSSYAAHYDQVPQEYYETLKKDFEEFLLHLINHSVYDHIQKHLNLWEEDKIFGINKIDINLHSIGIQKLCLIKFIAHYTKDVPVATQIMFDLVEVYDFYRQRLYETYLKFQHGNLQREKEFAETILDTTMEGIVGLDKELVIKIWNKAAADRTGIKKEDIIGKQLFDIFPNSRGFEEEMIWKAQNGEKIHLENVPMPSKPGHYDCDIVPWNDNKGQIVGSLSFTRDVTEKKKNLDQISEINDRLQLKQDELSHLNKTLSEKIFLLESTRKILEEKNRFIESIVQNTEIFITVLNLKEMKNIFINKSFQEFLGWDVEKNKLDAFPLFSDVIHPEDLKSFHAFFEKFAAQNKKTQYLEFKAKNALGQYRWIMGTYTIFSTDEDGQPLELVGISRDITEEKHYKHKLEDALNYYLTILDDFPALIWRSDTSGKCNYFNKTWLDFTGKLLDEEISNDWIQSIHPEDVKRCMDYYLENFRQQKSFSMEFRLHHHDGKYRWVVDMGKPIYDFKGNFSGYLGACFDIQDRIDAEMAINRKNAELAVTLNTLKKTEEKLLYANELLERKINERTKDLAKSKEELRQALELSIELNNELLQREDFLSSIIDQTPVPTYIVDAEGNLIRINQACLRLYDIEDPSTIIRNYNLLEDKLLMEQPFFESIKKVFEKGEMTNYSFFYDPKEMVHDKIKSNKVMYLNVTIFPIKNAEGKVLNAVVKFEDETDRLLAEEALKNSEEQLRLITESLPVLISYVDKDLNYRFVNKAYTEWFKKSKEEIIGRSVSELMGEHNFLKVWQLMDRALEGETIKSEQSMHLSEGQKDVLINYIPHISHGKAEGFYTLTYDISALKEAQKELIYKNRELTRINNDLDNFVYTASHDLKSPIVNLEGLMIALERTIPAKIDKGEKELFNMMGKSIGKLKSTISYLSDVTQLSKNFERNVQRLYIPEIVEEVKSDINNLIKATNAKFVENYHVKEMEFVKANMKSIFYNLLSNAIKYRSIDRDVIVNISTMDQDDHLLICVEDNGLGLTASQQTKLFSMFKRIHKQGEGSGIGLYILKRIVENANGKIEVESHINIGSKFKVLIPKKNGQINKHFIGG